MAASRYEISLLVLKKYFTRSRNIFQHSKRNFVSPRGHVISFIYYMNLKKSILLFFWHGYGESVNRIQLHYSIHLHAFQIEKTCMHIMIVNRGVK